MARIQPVDPAQTTGKAKELLDGVRTQLGSTPNMFTTMAVSPALLEGYLGLSGALRGGRLGGALGEEIALGVAEANECGYCLAAHTYLAKNVAKLSDEDVLNSRHFVATDAKTAAVLEFARAVVETRGGVSDGALDEARAAGLSDAELAEIVGHVALNVLTNYFNRAADVEIDFPRVELHRHAA